MAATSSSVYSISIHVLRVEDDLCIAWTLSGVVNFNPRPPCGGRQSPVPPPEKGQEISIHVLRVEDDPPMAATSSSVYSISIHVLRVEDDTKRKVSLCITKSFQSTSSVWRTTQVVDGIPSVSAISIHVLRVEDDRDGVTVEVKNEYFNPRPPCGGRLRRIPPMAPCPLFQSTSSVWRTTRWSASRQH